MNPIATVEDAMIAAIELALPGKLRAVDSIGGTLSLAVLQALAPVTPAVHVAFLGARQKTESGNNRLLMSGVFEAYVLTDHASGNAARRQGDSREIGAVDIINTLLNALHMAPVLGVGTLQAQRVDNLFTVQLDKQGVAVYALNFSIDLPFERPAPVEPLATHVEFIATPGIAPNAPVVLP